MMPDESWPFDDPPNVATITTRKVMSSEHVVDYVTHDEDDGGWQFLSRQAGDPDLNEAMLVSLANIVSKDASLAELADLPLGWCAWRRAKGDPWVRARSAHTRGAEPHRDAPTCRMDAAAKRAQGRRTVGC